MNRDLNKFTFKSVDQVRLLVNLTYIYIERERLVLTFLTRKTTKEGEKIIYIFSMNCSYATATRNERIVNYLEVAERKITFNRGIKSLVSIYLLILKKKKSLREITPYKRF